MLDTEPLSTRELLGRVSVWLPLAWTTSGKLFAVNLITHRIPGHFLELFVSLFFNRIFNVLLFNVRQSFHYIFIFKVSPVLLLCVHTLNNPSAHPSYSYYYLLSPSTLFFAHLIVLHFLFHCIFYSYFSFLPYICSCVELLLYNFYFYSSCTVYWADLIWFTFHFWLYPV